MEKNTIHWYIIALINNSGKGFFCVTLQKCIANSIAKINLLLLYGTKYSRIDQVKFAEDGL